MILSAMNHKCRRPVSYRFVDVFLITIELLRNMSERCQIDSFSAVINDNRDEFCSANDVLWWYKLFLLSLCKICITLIPPTGVAVVIVAASEDIEDYVAEDFLFCVFVYPQNSLTVAIIGFRCYFKTILYYTCIVILILYTTCK